MLSATIAVVLVAGLGYSLRSPGRTDSLIVRRPYNNRYSDAPGARQDHLA
jgi:hypothetical protein